MTDQELADKVVVLGVGELFQTSIAGGAYMLRLTNYDTPLSTELFVRDWRVAGALMEKCFASEIDIRTLSEWGKDPSRPGIIKNPRFAVEWLASSDDGVVGFDDAGELSRAIIEACVKALSTAPVPRSAAG